MVPKIMKPEGIHGLGSVDIEPLKAWVDRLSPTVWDQEDQRKENRFFCFHHTQHIVFRFIEENQDPCVFYSNPIWAIWKPVLLPIMEQAIAPYSYTQPTYPKAMLARLAAGHIIDRHVDGAGSNLYTHKIHIPLQTNPQATLMVNDITYHLQAGYAYEVNNIVPHGAENFGEADRIHFIFEVFDDTESHLSIGKVGIDDAG